MMSKKRAIAAACLAGTFIISCAGAVACKREPEEEKYTLTYARGAEDASGEIPEVKSYAAGESVTLLPSDTFTRTDYTFLNWTDGVSGYAAEATFTMPEKNVTLTAVWKAIEENPDGGEDEKDDIPETAELESAFYDASNWEYMTNDGGAKLDGGDVPYSLADGSIKFHRANQAINLGDKSNSSASFMLKGTNDWSIWFNSDTKDNSGNYSYRLSYASGGLRLAVSSSGDKAAALAVGTDYKKGEWNRIDVAFSTENKVCKIKLYINGKRTTLTAGDDTSPAVQVDKNYLVHTQPSMFETGNYMVVKVWEAHNYVQLKPIAKAETNDLPIIACIGASITEGAGAGNFYTESYPAQLQNALDGEYNVVNFGNSGKTVRPDLPEAWLNQNQWTGVQAIVPDMAIINMGTNDSKTSNDPVCTHDSFKADYLNLISELLKVNPDMKLYICTVPYAYTGIWDINNDNIKNIIAPVQREIASEGGYTLIDLYEYTQNKSLLFGDGVHPNSTGYAMFVEIIEKVLAEGEDGLTTDFLAAIDAKYNDKVSGYSASVQLVDDKPMLTVSGNTTLTEGVRVYVGVKDESAIYYNATISDGKFTANIDLSELAKTNEYYNIRVYAPTGYHIVTLNDTSMMVNDEITSSNVKVTVKSWKTNWGESFSLVIKDYDSTVSVTAQSVTMEDGKLVFSGTTVGVNSLVAALSNGDEIYDENVTINEDGTFTVRIGLEQLTAGAGNWYYLRIQVNGKTEWEKVPCQKPEVKYTYGDRVYRFEYYEGIAVAYSNYTGPTITLTSAVIEQKGDEVLLTVSGDLSDIDSRYDKTLLYIGNNANLESNYHETTLSGNSFTISFNLAELPVGAGMQIRFYHSRNDGGAKWGYYTLKIPEITVIRDGVEAPLAVNDSFTVGDKKITVKTSADWNPAELTVEDTSYSVTFGTIRMTGGKLIIKGTLQNVTSLTGMLYNNDNDFVNAVISIDGNDFTAEMNLKDMTAGAGNWYRFKISVNGGAVTNCKYPGVFDTTTKYTYETRTYKFVTDYNNTDIALVYSTHTYAYYLSTAEITEVDGKATLVIEGTMKDSTIAAENLKLMLEKKAGTTETRYVENSSTEAGTFRFVVDISDLIVSTVTEHTKEETYWLRLYNGTTKVADVNSTWVSDKLFEPVVIGNSTYYFNRNSSGATFNTFGICRFENEAQ